MTTQTHTPIDPALIETVAEALAGVTITDPGADHESEVTA